MKKTLTTTGIVLGALLSLSPLLGLAGTACGMFRAFHTLGQSGVSDPRALATDIGMTLWLTAFGLMLFPLGLVVLILSVVFHLKRPSTPPPLPPGIAS